VRRSRGGGGMAPGATRTGSSRGSRRGGEGREGREERVRRRPAGHGSGGGSGGRWGRRRLEGGRESKKKARYHIGENNCLVFLQILEVWDI